MTDYSPRKLYRNTRDAKVMGVCAGLADYLDVRTCVIRTLTIIAIIFSGGWVIALYVVMGLILDPMPEHLYRPQPAPEPRRPTRRERRHERWEQRRERREQRRDRRYWQRAEPSQPDYDTRDVRRRYETIERRLRNLEAYMTSKKFRLDRELRGLED
jgi:phage shock protein C